MPSRTPSLRRSTCGSSKRRKLRDLLHDVAKERSYAGDQRITDNRFPIGREIDVFSCAPDGSVSDDSEFDGPIPVISQALAVNKR
jgi:hypothetical protein